jgi:hypothetical protein
MDGMLRLVVPDLSVDVTGHSIRAMVFVQSLRFVMAPSLRTIVHSCRGTSAGVMDASMTTFDSAHSLDIRQFMRVAAWFVVPVVTK